MEQIPTLALRFASQFWRRIASQTEMIRQSSNPYLPFNYRPFATSLQVDSPLVAATESIEIKRLTPLGCLKGRRGDGLTRSTTKIAILKRVPIYLPADWSVVIACCNDDAWWIAKLVASRLLDDHGLTD